MNSGLQNLALKTRCIIHSIICCATYFDIELSRHQSSVW